jgi:hypothetical protein
MDSETNVPENAVQDGLQNEHNPISRDPERTAGERAEDEAAEEAEGVAEGVNEAAGPAEEKDREGDDDRELTTDTSPSD